jgi:predicted acetyltransferase
MGEPSLRRIKEREGSTQIQLALSAEKPDVSRLWALTLNMRIGPAIVKMGGVAGVGTNEAERGHGYASLVVEEATRFFRETGHDIAVLFGIPDFYHRFGYAPVLPDTTVFLNLRDVLQNRPQPDSFEMRPLQPADYPAVVELYNTNTATRTGTLVRSRVTWQGYRRGTQWEYQTETFVAMDSNNHIAAYIAFDAVEDACRVAEIGYQSPALFTTLLSAMIEKAERCGVGQIEICVPPNHPFAHFCRFFGCRVMTTYQRNQDAMARIINARSLFEKLTPLFNERIQASPLVPDGVLSMETNEGTAALAINNGQVKVCNDATPTWIIKLPQERLAQLVMGYRGIQEISLDDGVEMPPAAISLVDVLFPIGQPWMSCTDYF